MPHSDPSSRTVDEQSAREDLARRLGFNSAATLQGFEDRMGFRVGSPGDLQNKLSAAFGPPTTATPVFQNQVLGRTNDTQPFASNASVPSLFSSPEQIMGTPGGTQDQVSILRDLISGRGNPPAVGGQTPTSPGLGNDVIARLMEELRALLQRSQGPSRFGLERRLQ